MRENPEAIGCPALNIVCRGAVSGTHTNTWTDILYAHSLYAESKSHVVELHTYYRLSRSESTLLKKF